MPIKFNNKVRHFSYTSWSSWKSCAYRYGKKVIEGIKEPKSWALEKGIATHRKMEYFLKGKIQGMPRDLKLIEHELRELKRLKPIVEKFWWVDKKWKPVTHNGFCVMKMDASALISESRLLTVDLKTGKEYDSHKDQGNLYAAIGLVKYPNVEVNDVEMWYSDTRMFTNFTYRRKMLPELREYWTEQGHKILEEKKFLKSPERERCKWCPVRTDKGGDCDAWRSVR